MSLEMPRQEAHIPGLASYGGRVCVTCYGSISCQQEGKLLKLGHLDVLGVQRSKLPEDTACVNHSIHRRDYPPRNYQFTAEEALTGVEGKINRLAISYSLIKGTKAESCFETVNIQGGSENYFQKAGKQHPEHWSSSRLTPPPQAVSWQIKGTGEVPEGALSAQR